MPEGERNLARWMFRAPDDHPHWQDASAVEFAQVVASDLRSSFLRYPGFEEIELLTAELTATSPRFQRIWEAREPDSRPTVLKKLTIPGRGDFFFECEMLRIAETGQQLVTYCSEAGSPVREALRAYVLADSRA
ncbi:MAG TPA: hypothetical protein VHU90_03130, partial [Galbitalea sp.]|nr:hypothetical protein [Galbitalea sp.]